MAGVADHDRAMDIAIAYKPDEPRAFAMMPDMATTLLALAEVGRGNTGVTLDFCHMLSAGELPARSAMLAPRHSRILGVQLNDRLGKRDDGLIAGSVHPVPTVEFFAALIRAGQDGVICFDTFPDHGGLNPGDGARETIRLTDLLRAIAATLAADAAGADAQSRQDAAAATRIVTRALYGQAAGTANLPLVRYLRPYGPIPAGCSSILR